MVQCQNERSQFQNKDKAMQMLKAKLYFLKQQEKAEKLSGIRGETKEIGWGSQTSPSSCGSKRGGGGTRRGGGRGEAGGCWTATWIRSSMPI